jgi:hypothetical protein
MLGTTVTFILEKKFLYAAIASFAGAVLSFVVSSMRPRWRRLPIHKSRLAISSSAFTS